MMQKIRWAILLIGVIVLLAAVVQNSENVDLKLFYFQTTFPISVLMLVTATVSFFIGAITRGRWIKQSSRSKKVEQTAKVAEKPAVVAAPAAKPRPLG